MKEKRLKLINIENNIWILYLGIIALSFLSNQYEKDYFLNQNQKSKDRYRMLNTIIFSILLLVYTYWEKESISSLKEKNKTPTQEKYDVLSFIATTFVFLSGILFLYIILEDKDLEEEIAFN